MRNLESISIFFDEDNERIKFFDPKKWKLERGQLLPALEALELYSFERRYRNHPLEQIQHMLPLPSLKRLVIAYESSLFKPEPSVDLSTLEQIDISCRDMQAEDFEGLINMMPNINSIDYSNEDHNYVDEENIVGMEAAVELLRKRHTALTRLSVHFDRVSFDSPSYNGGPHDSDRLPFPEDIVGDLHAFTKLKYIDIDFMSTLGLESGTRNEKGELRDERARFIDKLPPSLETLRLFEVDRRVTKELLRLTDLDSKTQNLPKLRTIWLQDYKSILAMKSTSDGELTTGEESITDEKPVTGEASVDDEKSTTGEEPLVNAELAKSLRELWQSLDKVGVRFVVMFEPVPGL